MQNHYHAASLAERIVVVTTSYPRHDDDWVGHFVREEVLELRARGARVEVITPVSSSGSRRLSPFGPPGALARIAAFPPRLLCAAPWIVRACSALRHERFDAVIAHWAVPCGLMALSARAPRVEIVSHGSDVRLLIAAPRAVRTRVVAALVRRAAVWRFVSRELLESLLAVLEGPVARSLRARAVVQPAALRVSDSTQVARRAQALRAELGAFDVTVGRLVASKRVDRAISHAAHKRALLVVVGEGPERRALERHAERMGGRVRFVGALARSEALAYIAAADALVLASAAEGCSTVAREAIALSTAVERI